MVIDLFFCFKLLFSAKETQQLSVLLFAMNMKSRGAVKQYLIDITLKTLEINQPISPPSKVLCQIHYDDNYLKLKLQPTIKNGVASFYQQKIRIPYSSEVALVFKMQRLKKQTFLGHHMIDAQKSLQERVFHFKARQRLQESDAYIDFQVKVVDKQLFDDDLSDEFSEQQIQRISKSHYSQNQQLKNKLSLPRKPKSLLEGQQLVLSKKENLQEVPPIPQEFRRMLGEVEDIINKYKILKRKQGQKGYFKRDSTGNLKTEKIVALEKRLSKALQEQQSNNNIILSVAIGVSFALGFILA